MNNINQIKKELKQFEGKILREGTDIDIFIRKERINNFLSYLRKNDFIIKPEKEKISAYKFNKKELINLDLITDFNYLGLNFNIVPDISVEKYLTDKDYKLKKDIERYILLLKKDTIDREKIKQHFDRISTPIVKQLFRKIPKEYETLEKILDEKAIYLIYFLKSKYFKNYLKNKIKTIKSVLGNGKTICLEGPDGSGKSTMIKCLKKIDEYKLISEYMWNKNIYFDKLFLNMPKNLILKIVLSFALFFINWIRFLKIYLNKIKGKTILIERWPTYEYYLLMKTENKKNQVLFYLYKYLFPKPDLTILVYSSENIVFKRKQELNKKAIKKQNFIYKQIAKKESWLIFDNSKSITKSLNNLLKKLIDEEFI